MLKRFQFLIRTILIFSIIVYVYDWSNNYQFSSFIKLIFIEVAHGHDSPEYKIAIYDRMGQKDPYDANFWGRRSLFLFHDLKQHDQALVSYHQAITINPAYIYPHVTAVGIHQDLIRMKQELEQQERIRMSGNLQTLPHPDLPDGYLNIVNLELQNLEKMSTKFDYPNTTEDWIKRGNILFAVQSYLEALNAYDQALRVDSQSTKAWIKRGATLVFLQDYEGSLPALDQAIKLDPNAADPWGQKCLAFHGLGRYQEAINAANQAIALDPQKYFFQMCRDMVSNALNS